MGGGCRGRPGLRPPAPRRVARAGRATPCRGFCLCGGGRKGGGRRRPTTAGAGAVAFQEGKEREENGRETEIGGGGEDDEKRREEEKRKTKAAVLKRPCGWRFLGDVAKPWPSKQLRRAGPIRGAGAIKKFRATWAVRPARGVSGL